MVPTTFGDHLTELRSRLSWILASVIVFSVGAYLTREYIIRIVTAPLHGESLIYLNPAGGLMFIFSLCLYIGIFLATPVIIYHIFCFLRPVISISSSQSTVFIVLASILLALAGVVFGYVLIIPGAMQFLQEFAGESLVASLTADAYLRFVIVNLLSLAVLFQLPLLLFIVDMIKPIAPQTLNKTHKWVIAGTLIVGAIASPTGDPVMLFMIVIPVVAIYEIGVFVVWARGRRRSLRDRNEELATLTTSAAKKFGSSQVDLLTVDFKPMKSQSLQCTIDEHAAESNPRVAQTLTIDGVIRTRNNTISARRGAVVRHSSRQREVIKSNQSPRVLNRPQRQSIDGVMRAVRT